MEVRVRRRGKRLRLTVKQGSGQQRTEVEVELGGEQFDALWPLTEGRRIAKVRYCVPTEPGEIEVDVYGGVLQGLITAEIEFGSEAGAASFEPPDWIGEEVTGHPDYANSSLATRGLPAGDEIATGLRAGSGR